MSVFNESFQQIKCSSRSLVRRVAWERCWGAFRSCADASFRGRRRQPGTTRWQRRRSRWQPRWGVATRCNEVAAEEIAGAHHGEESQPGATRWQRRRSLWQPRWGVATRCNGGERGGNHGEEWQPGATRWQRCTVWFMSRLKFSLVWLSRNNLIFEHPLKNCVLDEFKVILAEASHL